MASKLVFISNRFGPLKKCHYYTTQRKFASTFVNQQKNAGGQLSRTKKIGGIVAISGVCGGIYYMTLSSGERRKIRVTCGGVIRFFR